MTDEKLALVFSGGGAKGAFGVGALGEIRRAHPRLRWDIVCGTSTGALITPLAALASHDEPKALDALVDFYLRARKKGIVAENFTVSKLIGDLLDIPEGLYNYGPLRGQLQAHLVPLLGALERSTVVAVVDSVSLQTGDLVLCTQDRHRPKLEAWFRSREAESRRLPVRFLPFAEWVTAMVASASIPGAIEPVSKVAGFPGEQLVDGGVVDIAPLRAALAAGATHIVCFLMSPRRSPQETKKFENPVAVALRSIDILTDEIMRDDVDTAESTSRMRSLADAMLSESAELPPRRWLGARTLSSRSSSRRFRSGRLSTLTRIDPPDGRRRFRRVG